MKEVVGIKFEGTDKVFYYTPGGETLKVGQSVIAPTAYGMECGKVVLANTQKKEEEILTPLRDIVRVANKEDLKEVKQTLEEEKKILDICQKSIKKMNLDMKLVHAKYTFDRGKLIVFFTANDRVDFRKLVKELASIFRTRIEMRHIGVRDEAKILGGIGSCGRSFCCSSYLDGFRPVSIKMAKSQNLSLNPAKISGACGRLMCCLEYEQSTYKELLKDAPENGDEVKTPDGNGFVIDGNILTGVYRVQMKDTPEAAPRSFSIDDLKILKDKKPVKKEYDDKM